MPAECLPTTERFHGVDEVAQELSRKYLNASYDGDNKSRLRYRLALYLYTELVTPISQRAPTDLRSYRIQSWQDYLQRQFRLGTGRHFPCTDYSIETWERMSNIARTSFEMGASSSPTTTLIQIGMALVDNDESLVTFHPEHYSPEDYESTSRVAG